MYRRHHAWLSADRTSYDVIEACSHVLPGRGQSEHKSPADREACDRLWRFFHNGIPKEERAWLELVGWIDYDDILLVDDIGDAFFEAPHVLVTRDHAHGFFAHTRTYIVPDRREDDPLAAEELIRASLFPNPIPEVEWQGRL